MSANEYSDYDEEQAVIQALQAQKEQLKAQLIDTLTIIISNPNIPARKKAETLFDLLVTKRDEYRGQ